jgi:hypothetical protein
MLKKKKNREYKKTKVGGRTGLAGVVLDVELEDTLDLLDLVLTLSVGETLEVLVNLGEESRGLETVNSESYYFEMEEGDRGGW